MNTTKSLQRTAKSSRGPSEKTIIKRERERAMEILQEEVGAPGTQSEIDRVMKALREKKLR